MQRILLGLGMIVFVGAVTAGATGAFFSDTETSTGNVFTAGAIDLKVDSTQHYNNAICVQVTAGIFQWQLAPGQTVAVDQYPIIGSTCDGTWTLTNLGPTNHFFNFGDVKPGDQGENTVSLHIDNNPAWACVNIKTTANDENTLTTPETNAGDLTAGPIGNGELAGNLHFQAWLDQGSIPGFQGTSTQGTSTVDVTEGDNIWQQGEPALASGALSNITGGGLTLPLADSSTGTPLPPTATDYIGIFWCAGTITGGAGNLGCDGSTMDNKSQTDSVKADVTFTVAQARNNAGFRCNANLGNLKVIKHVVHVAPADALITSANFSINVASSSGNVAGSPQPGVDITGTTYSNLQPATYTVSEIVGTTTPQGEFLTTTFSGDCNAVPTVAVTAGTLKTCTITNTYSINQ